MRTGSWGCMRTVWLSACSMAFGAAGCSATAGVACSAIGAVGTGAPSWAVLRRRGAKFSDEPLASACVGAAGAGAGAGTGAGAGGARSATGATASAKVPSTGAAAGEGAAT